MTKNEALTQALETLEFYYYMNEEEADAKAITAIKEALAQPKQEQNLKLMPREATPEMLKAMDECSTEGYDERLYEGHAGSVYMAAWDAFHGQHCYCGDITNLGVIHCDDGPCHYPDHKEPEKEPVAWMEGESVYWHTNPSLNDWIRANGTPLYTTPPQREVEHAMRLYKAVERLSLQAGEETEETIDWLCGEHGGMFKLFQAYFSPRPPQRTWIGLTDEEVVQCQQGSIYHFYRCIEAKLKEKNT